MRLVVPLLLTALLGVQAGAVRPAVAAAEGEPRFLSGQRSFSPNGDAYRDRLVVRYRVSAAGPVLLRVEAMPGKDVDPFLVRLGSKPAGRHTWTWDGRDPRGKVLPHGTYFLELRTAQGRAQLGVNVDLRFQARVAVAERYGSPTRQVQKVYPRSRVVRDAVRLRAVTFREDGVRSGALSIRNASGRVVVRRALRSLGKDGELAWEARDGRDRPLPPGRYVATVSGVDRSGNSGVSKPLRLWVSRDRLSWRKETRELKPQETQKGLCDWSGTPECQLFLPCGEVTPSTRLPGGLTHSTEPCAPDETKKAESQHFVPVPDAVRGLDAIRVAFTGQPTVPGTVATGNLTAGGAEPVVTSSSGGRTDWVEDPYAGSGWEGYPHGSHPWPRVPAGAFWAFWTEGPAVDVGTFTLDLRYLAVAE